MGLTKKEKDSKNCIKCGVALASKNWYKHSKKSNWRICKSCQCKQVVKDTKRLKKENPFRYKAYDLRYIYKGDIDSEDLKDQWMAQEGLCNICKTKLNKQSFHVDHIIPVSKGGTTEIDNLQFLCEMCNRGKFNWTQQDYIEHCKVVAGVN